MHEIMLKFEWKGFSKFMDYKEELKDLFEYDPEVLKTTSKKEYLDMAAGFWDTYGPAFEAFAEHINVTSELSSYILDLAEAHLPKTILKSKRSMQNMDDALFMVTFVLPALVSYNDKNIGVSLSTLPEEADKQKISECLKELALALSTSWGERFKVKPLGIATTLEIANAYEEHVLKKTFARFRKKDKS